MSSLRLSVHLSRSSLSGDGGETCSDYTGVTPDLCAQMALEYLVQNSINLSDTDVKNNGRVKCTDLLLSQRVFNIRCIACDLLCVFLQRHLILITTKRDRNSLISVLLSTMKQYIVSTGSSLAYTFEYF